jgi:acetate kinase
LQRVLCLNAGSSSLKAAGFVDTVAGGEPDRVVAHAVDRIHAKGDSGERDGRAYVDALAEVADACERAEFRPDVVAHRLVHGGPRLLEHRVIDDAVRSELEHAVSFAPLHLPGALEVLDAATTRYAGCAQVACLDTAFHRHLLPAARRLPIGADLDAAGIRRYGFHGLSYEYLVHRLGGELGPRAVLAHLGNGSSLAAVRDGVGIDTTMGLTPAGGIVMGTRPGDLDPGVLLHLLRVRGLDGADLERVVDRESGLFGVSGRSADVRDLLAARDAGDQRAALALEMYAFVAAKHVAAMTTVLGGLDTLVFTGGIGEHAAAVRRDITGRLAHLGVMVDAEANDAGAPVISTAGAPATVRVQPTDEELMMARHALRLAGRH